MLLKPLALCALLAVQAACVACAEEPANRDDMTKITWRSPEGALEVIYAPYVFPSNGCVSYRMSRTAPDTVLYGTIRVTPPANQKRAVPQ